MSLCVRGGVCVLWGDVALWGDLAICWTMEVSWGKTGRQGSWWHGVLAPCRLQHLCFTLWNSSVVTVWSWNIMVIFLKNTQNRVAIVQPYGRAMGCLLSSESVYDLFWKIQIFQNWANWKIGYILHLNPCLHVWTNAWRALIPDEDHCFISGAWDSQAPSCPCVTTAVWWMLIGTYTAHGHLVLCCRRHQCTWEQKGNWILDNQPSPLPSMCCPRCVKYADWDTHTT